MTGVHIGQWCDECRKPMPGWTPETVQRFEALKRAGWFGARQGGRVTRVRPEKVEPLSPRSCLRCRCSFSGDSSFAKHRVRGYSIGRCISPGEAGLKSLGNGVWGRFSDRSET